MSFGAFALNHGLCRMPCVDDLAAVSTVQEIEAAIPRLSRAEIEELCAWIDDFLEDQLELTAEVKAKLDQLHREIAAGNYTTRQPKCVVAAVLQVWSPTFSRAFDNLPPSVRADVERKVDEMETRLESFPEQRLKSRPEFKLRVGDYRVVL